MKILHLTSRKLYGRNGLIIFKYHWTYLQQVTLVYTTSYPEGYKSDLLTTRYRYDDIGLAYLGSIDELVDG